MSLEVVSVNQYNSPEELLAARDNVATNGMLKIGMLIVRRYVEGGWELSQLTQMKSYISILKWCYYASVSRGLCLPIESLDESYKRELWTTVRSEVAPDERVKHVLLDLTRVVHALNELAKLVYKNELEDNK